MLTYAWNTALAPLPQAPFVSKRILLQEAKNTKISRKRRLGNPYDLELLILNACEKLPHPLPQFKYHALALALWPFFAANSIINAVNHPHYPQYSKAYELFRKAARKAHLQPLASTDTPLLTNLLGFSAPPTDPSGYLAHNSKAANTLQKLLARIDRSIENHPEFALIQHAQETFAERLYKALELTIGNDTATHSRLARIIPPLPSFNFTPPPPTEEERRQQALKAAAERKADAIKRRQQARLDAMRLIMLQQHHERKFGNPMTPDELKTYSA